MLVIDPAKRIKLEQVYEDKWFSEGFEGKGFDGQAQEISAELHALVMGDFKNLGMDPSVLQKSLDEGAYDSNTATYYLLADKRINNNPSNQQKPALSPLKQKPKVNSKVNLLETFDEDGNTEQNVKPLAQKIPLPPPKTTNAAPTQPQKVVTAVRRRAATQTAADNTFVPDFGQQPEQKDLVPKVLSPVTTHREIVSAQTALPPTDTRPPVPARSRAHTIQTEKKDDQVIPIDKLKVHLENVDGPRTARFTFSVSTTSTKEPKLVFETVKKVLLDNQVSYKETQPGYSVACRLNDLEFELEICKLPNLDVVGLKCKRTNGDAWDYKELLSNLISKMDLGT